jgi:hypothetical protein
MSSSRSRSRSPYIIDDLAVAAHQTAAGILWRWRTEIAALLTLTAALAALSRLIALPWAAASLGGLLAVVLAVPHSRRFLWRRVLCVLARHRLHRLFYNDRRLQTRTGRIPLVLWIRPTKVGERAHVLCRAGVCGEDFEDNAAQLAAACYARDARVTRNRRWSHLVTIDIIRRDTLAAGNAVTSPLQRLTALYQLDAPGLDQLDPANEAINDDQADDAA